MNAGRNVWISLRLTPEEKERIATQAKHQGMSTGDYLRKMLQMQRVRKTRREREKLLQLARIGNNLNQLARWANTYKRSADSLLILAQLAEIEKELKCI